jgi:hypothetical protein
LPQRTNIEGFLFSFKSFHGNPEAHILSDERSWFGDAPGGNFYELFRVEEESKGILPYETDFGRRLRRPVRGGIDREGG